MSGCTYFGSRSNKRKHVWGIGVREMRIDGALCCKSWFAAQSRFRNTLLQPIFFFFPPQHQPKFTSWELKGKMFQQETWSSSGFSAWQCCAPSVSYSVSLVFPSYKNSKIFSFAYCLVCLFENKNYLFQQATKWKISSLEVELNSKQAQGGSEIHMYACLLCVHKMTHDESFD